MTTDRTGLNTMFGVIVLHLLAVSGSKAAPTAPIIYTYYSNTLLTWYQAAQYCLDQNGTLAKISNEIVASVLPDWTGWIGLHKPAGGDFRWMDCMSLGDYQPWYDIGHDGNGDVCVQVDALLGVRWMRDNCMEKHHFICEASGDECNFITYEKKRPHNIGLDIGILVNEIDCQRKCLSYYYNSTECIGYTYMKYLAWCSVYAGANLSVELPMGNFLLYVTGVKTCYTVQENSDIIIQESIMPVTFPNCEETSTSSIVYETTENVEVSMTTEIASSVMENQYAAISSKTEDEFGTSTTTVDDASMTTADISLESSSHDNVPRTQELPRFATVGEHPVISTTPVEVVTLSIVGKIGISTTTVDTSITIADNSLESSSQDNLPMATESERVAILTTPAEVVSLSATSADDVLTATAENNLELSSQDVSVTTQILNNNLESSATMCTCPCPRALSTNISITKEQITKTLLVKKTMLSSFRRKKESAKDDRPSAQAVGQVGVALLAAVGVVILLFDADVLIKFLKARLNPRKRLSI